MNTAHPSTAGAAAVDQTAVAEVRSFYEAFETTVNAADFIQNMSRGLDFFDLDSLRVFDILSPLDLRGPEFRQHFLATTASFPATMTNYALEIQARNDIAFASYLQICSGRSADGTPFQMRLRVTDGLRKIDGRWRIVHENISVPLDGPTLLKLMGEQSC